MLCFRARLGAGSSTSGEVAGARVCEVGAAAWSPAPFLELGAGGAVGDGAGGLVPPGGLVGVGLPVSGAEAVGVPGLVGFAGELVQVPGLGLDELGRLDRLLPASWPRLRLRLGWRRVAGRRRAGEVGGVPVVRMVPAHV